MHADLKDLQHVLCSDTTCLEHSQHLVSLSCLKAADRALKGYKSWTYYTSLATSFNVCRLMARSIYETWADMHGIRSAKEDCKRLWPKACSGRWSGCDKPEQRFLKCGESRLVPVLTKLLCSRVLKKQSGGGVSIDDLQIEETRAFSEKMTRWKKKTIEVIQDSLWWRCLEIMNRVRQPLSHLQNFLQQRQGSWGHIAQLCNGKAKTISQDFLQVWPRLCESGCLTGTDEESKFARNFAFPGSW